MEKFINLGTKSVHSIRKSIITQQLLENTYEKICVSDFSTMAISPKLQMKQKNKVGITVYIESLLPHNNFINGVLSTDTSRNGETLTLYPKNIKAQKNLQVLASWINSFNEDNTSFNEYISLNELKKYSKDVIAIAGGESSILHKIASAPKVDDSFKEEYLQKAMSSLITIFNDNLYIGYHEHFSNIQLLEEDLKNDIALEFEKVQRANKNEEILAITQEDIAKKPIFKNKRSRFNNLASLEEKTFELIKKVNKDFNLKYCFFFESFLKTQFGLNEFKEALKEDKADIINIYGYNRHLLSDSDVEEIAENAKYLTPEEVKKSIANASNIYNALQTKVDYTFTKDKDKYYPLNYILPAGYKDSREYVINKAKIFFEQYMFDLDNAKDLSSSLFGMNILKVPKQKRIKIYKDRLNKEIKVLDDISKSNLGINFYDYFLMVQDYLNFYTDNNISENWEIYFPHKSKEEVVAAGYADVATKNWAGKLGPGRGSAGGFLLSFMLGITKIDAIEYNLLMGRFINPERIGAPDIDNDFEQSTRMFMIRYFKAKYGEEHVAKTVTYTMYKSKNAFQQGLRLVGISNLQDVWKILADEISEGADGEGEQISLADHIDINRSAYSPLIADWYQRGNQEFIYETAIAGNIKKLKISNFKKAYDIAMELNGLIRGQSVHASAIFVTKEPIHYYGETFECFQTNPMTGLEEKLKVLKIDGYTAEAMGLLKFDILGVESLDTASKIEKEILTRRGEGIFNKYGIYNNININNSKIYETVFSPANTVGIFQFESSSMQTTLKQMFAKRDKENGRRLFDWISVVTAAERPGSKAFIPELLATKNNGFKPNPLFSNFTNELMGETFGIMIYQETPMQIYMSFGATEGQADYLRKGMAKKNPKIMQEIETDFKEKCFNYMQENGKNEKDAQDAGTLLWGMIEKFAGYGFNKAHSDEYSIISARMAYYKTFFNEEFYLGSIKQTLSGTTDKRTKMANLIGDMKNNGYTIKLPNINLSSEVFDIREGKVAYIGLNQIPTLKKKAQAIISERENNGNFTSFYNFIIRMGKVKLKSDFDKSALDNLIMSGALDSLIDIKEGFLLSDIVSIRNKYLAQTVNYLKLISKISDTLKEKPEADFTGLEQSKFSALTTKVDKNAKIEVLKPYSVISYEKEKLGVYISYDITELITLEVSQFDEENRILGEMVLTDLNKTPWGQKATLYIGGREVQVNDSKKPDKPFKFNKKMLHKIIKVTYGEYGGNRYIKEVKLLPEITTKAKSREEANAAIAKTSKNKNKSYVQHVIYDGKIISRLG